jgi:putative sterol carrier protein
MFYIASENLHTQILFATPLKAAERGKMKFDELVTKVRGMAEKVDASGKDFLAVQVNITGKDSGVFYVEVKDGKISVEPYEYNDRQCAITISMADFNKVLDGKLDPVLAFTTGKLKVDGDVGKAVEFSKALK